MPRLPAVILLCLTLWVTTIVAQESSVCSELNNEIDNVITLEYKDTCDCTGIDGEDGGTQLTCSKSDVCIASDVETLLLGDFSETFTKPESSASSFSQQTEISTCFDYESEAIYNGTKVCVTRFEDGLGTSSTCQVTIDGSPCNVCRFCQPGQLTFDCSNLGYENRLACGDNNADDSILQFLFEPSIGEGCESSGAAGNGSGGGGSGGGSSLAGRLRSTKFVLMASMIMAPLLLLY